jgi:long-subunit fatty acid transport protein
LYSVAARARRGGAALLTVTGLCAAAPSAAIAQERLGQDAVETTGGFTTIVLGSGARAFGMGGAFLARADDATAASWNPAGLSYLRRPEISVVGVHDGIDTDEVKSNGALEQRRSAGSAPDLMAFAYPFSFGSVSGSAQVSFQRALSFAAHRTIEAVETTRIIDSEGGFDVLALGSGVSVSRTFRAGATLNRWLHGYKQTLERQAGRQSLQTTDLRLAGWNLNVGAIWSPFEGFNVGAVGKTPFTANLRLSRERTDFNPPRGPTTQNAFASDDVRLDFPGAVGFGVSWRPRSQLTVSTDYTRTFWSKGRIRNFFTLPPTPTTATTPPVPSAPDDFFPTLSYPSFSTDESHQQDTEQIRVGMEYVFIRERFKWPVRAGYFSDRQILTAADGNAPRFNGVTVGAGVVIGPLLFDVAFLYESGDFTERNDSQTSIKARKLLASVIYRHGSSR